MAKMFDTQHLDEKLMATLSANQASWIYNGLDCCVTADIYRELSSQMEEEQECVKQTHKMALAKLAPIMEMSMRGTAVSEYQRLKTIAQLDESIDKVNKILQRVMTEVFGFELNYNSPTQLSRLFYSIFQVKEIKKRNSNGIWAPTTNEEALSFFSDNYLHAGFIARLVLMLRDMSKQRSFLKTEIDPDGRMRTSYNITGTNTGRLSSRLNEFGTGTNLQNVNRSLRFPFVSDPKKILVNIDLEQADGRNVGAICHEIFYDMSLEEIRRYLPDYKGPTGPEFASSYLDACESGDLHTTVCTMVWPDLGWPEDKKEWKSFCDDMIAHGQDSYRQLSKKGGHGTNYYGTPRTMAKHLHTSSKILEGFQNKYFSAFPVIKAWHNWTIEQIKTTSCLTTLFGRRRFFFGRADDATFRKAIAFSPQSMTGEQIDRGLYQVWKAFPTEVELLNQVHDSILKQIYFDGHEVLIPKILKTMEVPLTLKGGRKFVVPLDAKCGWNWGDYNDNPKRGPLNLHGLKKWKGREERTPPAPQERLRDYL